MANKPEEAAARLEPLIVSRTFDAPRELVFKAWTHADFIRRWFAPAPCTAPHAEVDFRVGGVFAVTMRLPDGTTHEMLAAFTHIKPHESLRFAGVVSSNGRELFHCDTRITFTTDGAGTRLTATQEYEMLDPTFPGLIAGAREGWRVTLDQLAAVVDGLKAAPPRSVVHGEFTIRRTLSAMPEKVFHAFADPAAKARWFIGTPGDWVELERTMDVREGGRERAKGRWKSGVVTQFDAVYLDVVPNERLVYAYEMRLDERKISVSLASLTIEPDPVGTLLTITEQGAFLDGYEDAGSREKGTGELLDRMAATL